jgi:hypothetical protein
MGAGQFRRARFTDGTFTVREISPLEALVVPAVEVPSDPTVIVSYDHDPLLRGASSHSISLS